MNPLVTVVPGSRHPVSIPSRTTSPSRYNSSSSSSDSSLETPLGKLPSYSTTRRKPRATYQSPTSNHPTSLCIEKPNANSNHHSSTSQPRSMNQQTTSDPSNGGRRVKKKYPMGPPLPLYHPLGRLALSLPELDPESFGLPNSLTIDSDSSRRASSRARRPAAKVRDIIDDKAGSTSAVAVSSTAVAQDSAKEKEKASPRKRRAAGQGAGGKRKRKDGDYGDSTYPAKRTRNPRGGGVSVANAAVDESVAGEVEEEEKRPERRTRRVTRTAVARRGSSASDATNTEVAVTPKEVEEGDGMEVDADVDRASVDDQAHMDVEEHDESPGATNPAALGEVNGAVSRTSSDPKDGNERSEKEDGELSEEAATQSNA
ncbi:hypothetical protein JAAARDRAFT_78784 [Jaapia argillacea MUCL 33604]|uniref:Uncharacterized protein n=1 Tax=Jaapia argillacea MUCL 33604 TaxID=933084 RepID=A0A067PV41_9AGAM|nr:hypothetical protein JAAARDRAFT_78784 [Jaapia argillacea MUCL 33604]